MKKAKNRVDANHVREAPPHNVPEGIASSASSLSTGQGDQADDKPQHRQPPIISDTGKGFSGQFPPSETTRTDRGSASAETSSLETQGIVRRILANVNNSPVHEEAFVKQPICLAKRGPKVKPKPAFPVKVAEVTRPQVIKETADKKPCNSPERKGSQDFARDHAKSGTSEVGGANIHSDVNSGWRRGVKNQNLSAGGATARTNDIGREDVCRNKLRGETQKTGKRGVSVESEEYNMCTQKSTQLYPAALKIVKSDCNEKRNSLVEQKGSFSGRIDDSDINFGNEPGICSPPLPPSFSRDSGISSPSVDEVKPIDQRTDEPKDNEGPMRGLRGERGNSCGVHDDKKSRQNSEKENEVMSGGEIVEKSLTVNNVTSSVGSSFDSKQAGDREVCSELNLSSYPPSATLLQPESISCQGETNPVVSPLAPIVGQTDKAMVTALGIDEADAHASMDSRLVSSDLSDDEPVTSANSTSVDATTTHPPARHSGSVEPALSTSDSTTGVFATESSALVEQNVNINKTGIGLAEQTTVLQTSASNSSTNETCANSDLKQTNQLPSGIEETAVLETGVDVGDTRSITTSNAETPAAIATSFIPKTSATLSLITATVNSNDQRLKLEHNNQSKQHEHQQSQQLNQTENSIKGDIVLNLEENVHDNHRQSLDSDCSICSCNIDIVEQIKPTGVEEEELHQKPKTEEGTTALKVTQEVITRDTEIITETCDILTSIKSIESQSTSGGPSQCDILETLPPLKPKRAKLNFRDINIQEVISLQSDSPGQKLKGILKSKSNECINGSSSSNCVREIGTEKLHSARSVSFKKTHTKSTFSYHNAAFEGEIKEEPSRRPSLADVVTHIMRTNSVVDIEEEEDNSHPYGRDNSLTDLINGKRRENINMDAGKMIVWLALAIMIVSLAGVIIFMSESYNLTHQEEVIYFPPDDTTLSHS